MCPSTVIDTLVRRRAGGTDDHTVAVAVEGGGMRGVVSGAMLIALRDLGFLGCVDRFYGTSASGLNLAYLAAGRGWDALSIYYDHLVEGFVRRRPGPGRPLLDMARVAHVIRDEVPLQVEAVGASSLDVRLVLSDVERRAPVVVPVRGLGPRLPEHLIAAAWLPVLAGPPYVLEGRRTMDGGLLWPDPLYAAVDGGCSHVLALGSSTDQPERATPATRITAALLTAALDEWAPGLGGAFRDGRARWDVDRTRLSGRREIRIGDTTVVRVQPVAGAHGARRLTRDRAVLLDAARAGYRTVCEAFGSPLQCGVFAVVG